MKNDFATKADLKKTADGLHHEISAVRTDLSRTEKTLHQEIAAVRTDVTKTENALRQEIAAVRKDLHQEIVTVKEDLHQEIMTVRIDLNDFKEEFVAFRQRTDNRFDDVMTAIDGLAGLIIDGQTEKASVECVFRTKPATHSG